MADEKPSVTDELLKLTDLKDKGALSDAEFVVAKAVLLQSLQAQASPVTQQPNELATEAPNPAPAVSPPLPGRSRWAGRLALLLACGIAAWLVVATNRNADPRRSLRGTWYAYSRTVAAQRTVFDRMDVRIAFDDGQHTFTASQPGNKNETFRYRLAAEDKLEIEPVSQPSALFTQPVSARLLLGNPKSDFLGLVNGFRVRTGMILEWEENGVRHALGLARLAAFTELRDGLLRSPAGKDCTDCSGSGRCRVCGGAGSHTESD